MDNSVYIIHRSAIIQNGLADILSKHFKCHINMFPSFHDFRHANEIDPEIAIIFIDEEIATSKKYLQFIGKYPLLKSVSIITSLPANNYLQNENFIHLYNSPDEIYEQVKTAFKETIVSVGENKGLTNRDIEVLRFVALGFSNKEIADKLNISAHTVMSHRKNMTEKLGIKSISGLTVYAIINDYIDTTNININDLI